MSDQAAFERNDTGIISLADFFRHDRLPCRAEPKRWLPAGSAQAPQGHERGSAAMPAAKPTPCP